MIYRYFEAQMNNRTSKDWVTMVMRDMEVIDMNMKFEDIKRMKKGAYMNILKRKMNIHALKYLSEKQATHSKVNSWTHSLLTMQKYLKPNSEKIKVEDSQLIFKLRCKMIEVKMNFKRNHETHECRACENHEETQEHIYDQCKTLMEFNKELHENPEYKKYWHSERSNEDCRNIKAKSENIRKYG